MNEIISVKNKIQIWQEQIAAQVGSGQSVRAFCIERQIHPKTFYYWKKKLSEFHRPFDVGRFIKIGKHRHGTKGLPWIQLPNGVKIELGESLESSSVNALIRSLCGVGAISELRRGRHAKS